MRTTQEITIKLLFLSMIAMTGLEILLSGCSQVVTNADIPHTEKIMVNGALIQGQPVRNIQIMHTIAPLDTFDTDKVGITDADARITVDGKEYRLRLQSAVDSVPLQYSGRLIPGPTSYEAPELIVEAGKTYSLRVDWNGKRATASTRVPLPPIAESLPSLRWRLNIIERNVTPLGAQPVIITDTSISTLVEIPILTRDNELYSVRKYILHDTAKPQVTLLVWGNYSLPQKDVNGNQRVRVSFSGKPDAAGNIILYEYTPINPTSPFSQPPKMIIFSTASTVMQIDLEARDGQIIPFLETASRLYEGQQFNPFGSNGRNPEWNVHGDGIGLFIGQSTTTTIRLRP